MCRRSLKAPRMGRMCTGIAGLLAAIGLAACDSILDVKFPGRIPAEEINDPALAPVLARSVIGDFECAYNNYATAAAVHSDEFEGGTRNGTVLAFSHRNISPGAGIYVSDPCEAGLGWGPGGLHVPMQGARFLAEDVYRRLDDWTDEKVPNRTALMATVRAYNAYTYTFFAETYCSVAFDGGPEQQPADALRIAEQRFSEAISLAQAAGAADILDMARVGMARVKLNLKEWSEAESFASQVPAGYRKDADRGAENDRRWNKLFHLTHRVGAYVVSEAYRTMDDPRVMVADAQRDAADAGIRLWVTTKYTSLASPLRLASYEEAQLIAAEARAEQGDVTGAMQILNARRAALGLPELSASDQEEAVRHVIDERQRELSFEGGHRLNDLLRKNISWKNGVSPTLGIPYGRVTCWPFPTQEESGA